MKLGCVLDPHLSQTSPASRTDNYPQAMLDKFTELGKIGKIRGWEALIIAGDLFHTKRIEWDYLGDITETFMALPFPIYLIYGNHDLYNDSLSSSKRTPLGYLLRTRLVRPISELMPNIVGLDLDKAMQPPPAPQGIGATLLICHAFVDMAPPFGVGGWEFIPYSQLAELGWDVVIAGHDHTPHPVLQQRGQKLQVYRPGSLSRGTRHEFNRERMPKALEIRFDDSRQNIEIEEIEVPASQPSDIFSLLQIERGEAEKRIQDFAMTLPTVVATESEIKLAELVDALKISSEAKALLRRYMIEAGLLV